MKNRGIKALRQLMARLRSPEGCPWDRAQTLKSLIPFIIEEAYEVVSAIESEDPEELKEELGDLLFQIVFASRLAEERGWFDLEDVLEHSLRKMVRRHPHVFGGEKAATPDEVLDRWAEIKRAEKEDRGILGHVPEAMPALLRAHKISKRAARAGFDWKDMEGVLKKVREELDEFEEAARSGRIEMAEEELGDLLFTIVNAARFLEVSPEEALRKTVGKFIRRFHYVEKGLEKAGIEPRGATMEEMERLWQEAKTLEKKPSKTGH